MHDIIIIGAGPAGLSVAIAARQNKLDALLVEKGTMVNSIVNFPTDMTFFSTSELLEIGSLPFNSSQMRPTRRETVRYYQQVARYFQLKIMYYHLCDQLSGSEGDYTIRIRHVRQDYEKMFRTRNVVFATGFFDVPKWLNVPGEDLPHVSHYYREPFPYHDQDVVIVGAGNSAVEAALDIHRNGGRVTLLHHGAEIKKGVKYWILPDILNRIEEGSIRFITNARVVEITQEMIRFEKSGLTDEIQAQHVLALTGYQPERNILEIAQVRYNAKTLEPEIDPDTFESSRSGIFFAGSMVAGIFPNRIFIENSRTHGDAIVKHILSTKR